VPPFSRVFTGTAPSPKRWRTGIQEPPASARRGGGRARARPRPGRSDGLHAKCKVNTPVCNVFGIRARRAIVRRTHIYTDRVVLEGRTRGGNFVGAPHIRVQRSSPVEIRFNPVQPFYVILHFSLHNTERYPARHLPTRTGRLARARYSARADFSAPVLRKLGRARYTSALRSPRNPRGFFLGRLFPPARSSSQPFTRVSRANLRPRPHHVRVYQHVRHLLKDSPGRARSAPR
jgi:hypothetical protein